MEHWEKINAVQKMQDYISKHICDDITVNDIVKVSGYSKRHASRLFKEMVGKTVLEYVRAIRLTDSAKKLISSEENILDIALTTHYDSHEGYLRAFTNEFGILPQKYRQEKPPVSYFVQYPIKHYYSYLKYKGKNHMEKNNQLSLCTVTVVKKPKRKLILLRATKAVDYWTFCEEWGCEWEGLLNSIDCKFDTAFIMELPKYMIAEGTTFCAAGVEVPEDYTRKIPEGYDCVELPECEMMIFQSQPYENEDNFCEYIDAVSQAIQIYDPKHFGYEFAYELAPKYNYGSSKEMGAKQAIPVKKLT